MSQPLGSKVLVSRLGFFFGMAAVCQGVASIIKQDWYILATSLYEVGVALIILLILWSLKPAHKEIRLRFTTCFYVIAFVTLWVGLGFAGWNGEQSVRVQLFYTSANYLAASLCLGAVTTLLLDHKYWHPFTVVIAIVAVFNTGSRAAFLTLLLLFFIWILTQRRQVWWSGSLLVLTLLGFLLVGRLSSSFLRPIDAMLESPNLLKDSEDLRDSFWVEFIDNQKLQIDADVFSAPAEDFAGNGKQADRLIASAGEAATLVFYQNVGVSQTDTPYIASVYLRADTQQKVVLNNNISKTICDVSNDWGRCVTPVGYGDERRGLQLRLETAEKGGSMDIYVYGAQLEVGERVTPYKAKYRVPVRYYLLKRFDVQATDFIDRSRLTVMKAAWQDFLRQPLWGVGTGQLFEVARRSDTFFPELGHAHNVLVQILATGGLLGLAAWALPLVGVLILFGRRHWRNLVPLYAAVILLNLTDIPYYSAGFYYPFWISVGLVIFADAARLSLES
jgi:O-antigen ligase